MEERATTVTTTVTLKGQVTIPGAIRRALKIQPKDKVSFVMVNGEIRLRLVGSRVMAGYGAVRSRKRPEDFRRIRREVEEEMGEGAAREG
ncbi:MAG: AbrB/MazE/SpoVT family DNA-binding domain-containing protein [Chloroflexi bacterium]|nr:AbrB/MazE/SpoVT family DNA-binding domain-containing protein [Chloroflexota bacterium]